jgi:hypothetical protein
LISHADVVGVRRQIFWRCHHCELNGTLVAKGLVGPFSDGSDLLDSRDTVVGDKDLKARNSPVSLSDKSMATAPSIVAGKTHRSNNGVALMLGNEILDAARSSSIQVVATNEM